MAAVREVDYWRAAGVLIERFVREAALAALCTALNEDAATTQGP
ncbi:hypothetical protein [Streptomyces antimycoticus]|nr:hypothetical protein [Streptomyces antimycoticus]